MNLATIPGFLEAVAEERFARDAAFLPVTETVAGVEVRPLTLRTLCILQAIDSPFVMGRRGVTGAEVAAFLWVVSSGYNPSASWRRRRFVRRLRDLPFADTVAAINAYLGRTFADLASGGPAQRSYYSTTASLVDLFAGEYGWSEAAILDLPVTRAIQYQRAIERRRFAALGQKPVQFNPSDRVVQNYLEQKRATTPAPNPLN